MAVNTIKFAILSQARRKEFLFNVEKFTSFNNENAIYLLYTYSRILSLLDKSDLKVDENKVWKQINQTKEATRLMNYLHKFPFYVEKSMSNYDPHYLVVYALELAKRYNGLYQNIRFIGNEKFEDAGIYLSMKVKEVLEIIFEIIGIKPIREI